MPGGVKKYVSDNKPLAEEWNYSKNSGSLPSTTLRCSNKRVWWACSKGHEWKASPNNRSRGDGCPYCSGKAVCAGNCLAVVNPGLAEEWHPVKNDDLTPRDITEGSNKKVWWRCGRGHEWRAPAARRRRGSACPYCTGQLVSAEASLLYTNPELASEWHQAKNGELAPGSVLPGSHRKVWWFCSAGHEWPAVVSSRSKGHGCPYCSGNSVCLETSLLAVKPALAEQWHPTKNPGVSPNDVTAYSHKKVWWKCAKGHEWAALVSNRAQGKNCPYCSNQRLCGDNCLATTNPALSLEWHPSKNKCLTPYTVFAGSSKKVWWQCAKGHEWRAGINSRNSGVGCPHCAQGSISKISQQWLDSLGIPEEFREFQIKLPGRKRAIRVDGFDPKTSTVYEFLGDYWHGNPDLYDSEDVNAHNKRTFGVLYNQTMRRLERLKKAGYSVVFIWEQNFKEVPCT